MPIIKSAKKREKQTIKRTEELRPFRTRMQTMFKNMKKWAEEGNSEKVAAHASETFKAIDMAAKKNIIHDNNASRKKSLIQKILNKLGVNAKAAVLAEAGAPKAEKKVAPKAPAKKPAAKKPAAKKAA